MIARQKLKSSDSFVIVFHSHGPQGNIFGLCWKTLTWDVFLTRSCCFFVLTQD